MMDVAKPTIGVDTAGGKAVAVVESVEKGEKIVEAAVAAFGGLHSALTYHCT